MGVRTITSDSHTGDSQTVFYCSTSCWAFGPVVESIRMEDVGPDCFGILSEEIADRMLKIVRDSGSDIRRTEWTESKLIALMQTAREQLIKEANEPCNCDDCRNPVSW